MKRHVGCRGASVWGAAVNSPRLPTLVLLPQIHRYLTLWPNMTDGETETQKGSHLPAPPWKAQCWGVNASRVPSQSWTQPQAHRWLHC